MTAGDDDVLLSPEVCGHAAHVGSRPTPRTVSSSSVCLSECLCVRDRERVCACMDALACRLPSAASSFSFKIEMDCVAPFY